MSRRGFGAIRRLPSGRYQASYVGPDLRRYAAPQTFEAREDAEGWLAVERRRADAGDWRPPKERTQDRQKGQTLRGYAPGALDRRRVRGEPLRPRTRALYDSLLRRVIYPTLGDLPLKSIRSEDVQRWHDDQGREHLTQRAHAYSLLRAIMLQAVEDHLIPASPCQIRGAGRTTRKREIRPATLEELATITKAMPERLRMLVLLGAWAGLRFGELAELRRRDVDTKAGTLKVSRAVVRVDGRYVVGPPKSAAGDRTVSLPPHLLPALEDHLARHVRPEPDGLLFARPGTNTHLIHTEVTKLFVKARAVAGRPDLRLHDLRHTQAVMAAQAGATLAELMARLGHSTVGAALRYQHAAQGRDAEIARLLSALAERG